MRSKESGKVRYAYGVATALLLGGTAFSLATGSAGAQVAQNAPAAMAPRPARRVLRRPRRPAPAGGGQHLDQAARAGPHPGRPVRGILPPLRHPDRAASGGGTARAAAAPPHPRDRLARLGLHHFARRLHRHQQPFDPGRRPAPARSTRSPSPLTDRREYPARIVGRDATSDLARAQDRRPATCPIVQWGDSTRARVGDWVARDRQSLRPRRHGHRRASSPRFTAGSPASAPTTATSRPTRPSTWAISGGPMFDLNGNVIGINSALISPTGASVGIGLAIPAELAKPVIDSLRRGQRPQRGYLGVGLQPLDENHRRRRSACPRTAARSSARSSAGRARRPRRHPAGRRHPPRQRPATVTPDQTVSYLDRQHAGRLARPARASSAAAAARRSPSTVGQRPTEEELARSSAAAATLRSAGDSAAGRRRSSALGPVAAAADSRSSPARSTCRRRARGVVITAVDPNSDAAEKGLQRGDLIVSVNNQLVTDAGAGRRPRSRPRGARAAPACCCWSSAAPAPEAFVGVDISRRARRCSR